MVNCCLTTKGLSLQVVLNELWGYMSICDILSPVESGNDKVLAEKKTLCWGGGGGKKIDFACDSLQILALNGIKNVD